MSVNGRPNRAVQTVLGVHLLKEMFNLTAEALEQLNLSGNALRLSRRPTCPRRPSTTSEFA